MIDSIQRAIAGIEKIFEVRDEADNAASHILLRGILEEFLRETYKPSAIEQRIVELQTALARVNAQITAYNAMLGEPSGYAVASRSAAAPNGFWFVGLYHSEETAKRVLKRSPQAKGEYIIPVYFKLPNETEPST